MMTVTISTGSLCTLLCREDEECGYYGALGIALSLRL
jgi:hypothetical protein